MSLKPRPKKSKSTKKSGGEKGRRTRHSKRRGRQIAPSFFKVSDSLNAQGAETYLVGGAVRDLVVHSLHPTEDFAMGDLDIATDMLPDDISKTLKASGISTIEVGKQFGTIIAHTKDEDYEVTTFRTEGEYEKARKPTSVEFVRNLEEDMARRDFTINALAIDTADLKGVSLPVKDLKEIPIIDPFGGINDLRNGVIRTVGDPDERFNEDALRMMRLARFSARLNLEPTTDTIKGAKRNADLIDNVSRERVKEEMDKLMKAEEPSSGFYILQDIDVLERVLPEVDRLSKVTQEGTVHKYNAFDHTLAVIDAANDKDTVALLKGNDHMRETLMWVALLHDIGKADTKTRHGGKTRFYGHDKASAEQARIIMKRLKASKKQTNMVEEIIRKHQLFHDKNAHSEKVIRRQLNRLAEKYGEENAEPILRTMIAFTHADQRGTDGTTSETTKVLSKYLDSAVKKQGTRPIKETLAVDGRTIMKWLDIQGPSREIGVVKSYLTNKVIDDPSLNNKKDLKRLFDEKYSKNR